MFFEFRGYTLPNGIDAFLPFIPLLAGMAALISVGALLRWRKKSAGQRWELFAEGVFESAKYKDHVYTRRSGAMVHHTSRYTVRVWQITFDRAVLYGLRFEDEPKFPKRGSHIKVMKNGMGRCKVE